MVQWTYMDEKLCFVLLYTLENIFFKTPKPMLTQAQPTNLQSSVVSFEFHQARNLISRLEIL